MKAKQWLTALLGDFVIIKTEKQNKAYQGHIIKLIKNGETVRLRVAKKTPKKQGYFVSFWEKNNDNKNIPFQANQSPDYLAIVIDDTTNIRI